MKNYAFILLMASMILATIWCAQYGTSSLDTEELVDWEPPKKDGPEPSEYMFRQRTYPSGKVNAEKYHKAIAQTKQLRAMQKEKGAEIWEWEQKGPLNVGGRITDLAPHPTNPDILYVASATGGVWKTMDRGESWTQLSDDWGYLSIGNLAIDPQNPETIYVGTGEANASFDSGTLLGNGIYKSTDGGDTWEQMGLDKSEHIARLVVDPNNSNRIYAAATGRVYGRNEERGVYVSEDAGETWERKLFINDTTACIDLVVNSNDSDIVYAAMWERVRYPWGRQYAGGNSGIYRSKDGGETWDELTDGLPVTERDDLGRIGLAISKSNPDILYATFTYDEVRNFFHSMYRTADGGDTWERVEDGDLLDVYVSFGWYFGNVRVHPENPQQVYTMGVDLYRSTNNGNSWTRWTSNMHVDFHALEYHPANPDIMYIGNDGGLYISENGGDNWQHINNLPITQFYTCEIDRTAPERLYGGSQDNGTLRTFNGDLDDWERIHWGDGFKVLVDPENPAYLYAESQWGNIVRSTDGGSSFLGANSGISGLDRKNWNTPYEFNPLNSATLYYGANRLYKSTTRAKSWERISDDLTRGGRDGANGYGTISTIGISPVDTNILWIGSDDGKISLSMDEGANWTDVSTGRLAERYVTCLAPSYEEVGTVYATLSGYTEYDYLPHVYKSTNFGETWVNISSNLPDVPVNDLIIDPDIEGTLYIATDVGAWVTKDDGASWELMGTGLPLVITTDLSFDRLNRTLAVATFGRSMFTTCLEEPTSDPWAVGIEEEEVLGVSLNVYPNPISDRTTIELQSEKQQWVEVKVFDVQGKLVVDLGRKELMLGKNFLLWEVDQQVAAGNYWLVVETSHALSVREQLVVE